jgi:hypothetical protein
MHKKEATTAGHPYGFHKMFRKKCLKSWDFSIENLESLKLL